MINLEFPRNKLKYFESDYDKIRFLELMLAERSMLKDAVDVFDKKNGIKREKDLDGQCRIIKHFLDEYLSKVNIRKLHGFRLNDAELEIVKEFVDVLQKGTDDDVEAVVREIHSRYSVLHSVK